MLAIEVRFAHGRYHATPWDRHVNEGQPEWPPSPFRLLRALVAAWHRLGHPCTVPELERLLQALSEPPEMYLPPWTTGHTRYYVPVGDSRNRLLDTFVSLDQSGPPLTFLWPHLDDLPGLQGLLTGIPYFGRAESLCRMRLAPTAPPSNCRPLRPEENESAVRLLCGKAGIKTKEVERETHDLRKAGLTRPPGTQWVNYQRPHSTLAEPPERRWRSVVFLLDQPVPKTRTLQLADRVRRQLLKGEPSSTVTGRRAGVARTDGHQHLHILPEGEEQLDRVRLWSPEGFGRQDLALLAGLRKLPRDQGQPPLPLIPWGLSEGEEERGRVWRSDTPYLLTRHPKANGKDGVEEQLRRECEQRGLPLLELTVLGEVGEPYVTQRGPRQRPPGPGWRMELRFAREVDGPLCLGASSHFGMGRFRPVGEQGEGEKTQG